MLANFRHWAKGIVSKLLLGFLVLTFAIWGIGDIFRGTGTTTIATVGEETISTQDLNLLIDRLQRSYAQITPELASSPQFRLQALQNLVDNSLLSQEARHLGLHYDRETLAGFIARNPMFQREDGSFNRELFQTVLQQNGWSERDYLSRLSEDLSTALLRDTVSAGLTPPEALVKSLHAVRNETREARLILIDKPQPEKIKVPDDAALERIYKENSTRFTTPERRDFAYAHFKAAEAWTLLKREPDETILRTRYEEQKDTLRQPEKREVEQWLFADKKQAQTAYESRVLDSAEGLLNKGQTSLGLIAQTELPPAVADRVFALEENTLSEPVNSDFGWHLFRVRRIEPEHIPSFDEAKAELAEAYRAEHTETAMNELSNNLEDAVAGGATLAEALQQAGLAEVRIRELKGVAADGSRAGNKALSPIEQETVQLGYSLQEGDISPLSLAENGDYFIVAVTGIAPSALPPLKEIRPQLVEFYEAQARRDALRKQAENLAAELKEAENPLAAARASGAALHASGPLKRGDDTLKQSALKDTVVTAGFVEELFALPKHGATGAYPLPSGAYLIGILESVTPAPAPDKESLKALESELAEQISQDAMEQFMAALRARYPVEIEAQAILPAGAGE